MDDNQTKDNLSYRIFFKKKCLWDIEIQMNHTVEARRPDLIIVTKSCHVGELVGLAERNGNEMK